MTRQLYKEYWPHGYETREGDKVTILVSPFLDAPAFGLRPILWQRQSDNFIFLTHSCGARGIIKDEHHLDIFCCPDPNAPFECWVNVYADGDVYAHETKDLAEERAKNSSEPSRTIRMREVRPESEKEPGGLSAEQVRMLVKHWKKANSGPSMDKHTMELISQQTCGVANIDYDSL